VASIFIPGGHSLRPVKNSFVNWCRQNRLSPEVPILAQNAPQTVCRPGFARTRRRKLTAQTPTDSRAGCEAPERGGEGWNAKGREKKEGKGEKGKMLKKRADKG